MSDKNIVRLLDEVDAIRKREKLSVRAFAQQLGKNYQQVHRWLIQRRWQPYGPTVIALIKWRDQHTQAKSYGKKI